MDYVDTPTRWQGVIVRKRTNDSEKWVGIVLEALRTIASCHSGQQLLDGISAWYAQRQAAGNPPPYAVCILPKDSHRTKPSVTLIPGIKSLDIAPLTVARGTRVYEEGSVTKSAGDDKASDGRGTFSAIRWDPIRVDTPDGARPAYIALAHELIHAYNNMLGRSYLTGTSLANAPAAVQTAVANAPNAPDTRYKHVDEWATVGLHGFGAGQITENQIRQELGIAPRSNYTLD